jgi:hypothetical protein
MAAMAALPPLLYLVGFAIAAFARIDVQRFFQGTFSWH